jgi:HEAT repeat protein
MMMNEFEAEAQTIDFYELLALLKTSEEPLSRRTLSAMSNLEPQQITAVQQVWKTLSEERRTELARKLHTLAEDNVDLEFRPIFRFCLEDSSDTVRAIAVEGLWEDDSPHMLRALLQMLHDPASQVREAVLLHLSRFAYSAALEELQPEDAAAVHTALLQAATDSTQPTGIQRRAVEGLGYFADSAAAQAVVEQSYASAKLPLRESAIVAMGRSMRREWFPVFEQELRSSSPVLRYAATQAVGELAEDGQPLLSALLPLVEDDDHEVAQSAVWALGQMGGQDAERVLKRLVRSKKEWLRQAAEDALGELLLEDW